MFYKVIKDSVIVDAMENVVFVRQNIVNKVVIVCPAEFSNGIVSSDGSTVWQLEGQPEFIEGTFETVKLVEINETEYNKIKEVLVDEKTVGTEDERIREPMTTTEVLEKIDALQKEVDSLKEENIQLKAEISTLRG